MKRVNYVVLEGIDGAGKTKQGHLLCRCLRKLCYTPIPLSEPTWGRYGRMIRNHIASGDELSLERQHELFTLDRREHIERTINPLLDLISKNESFLIVQDRGYLSAPAYQSKDEAGMAAILKEQQSFAPKPNIFVLLDVSPEIAAKRKQSTGEPIALPFSQHTLEKVRQRYLLLAKESSERVKIVDADQPPESVVKQILEVLRIEKFEVGS